MLDEAAKRPNIAPIADMTRVAVAGHSFGSYTAMAVAGMLVHVPAANEGPVRSFRDERVKVIIAMSPQGPGVMGVEEDGCRRSTCRSLLMTGSKDMGQGERAVSWRLTAFQKLKNDATRLLYIKDATHMTFSEPRGRARGERHAADVMERHDGFIEQTCTAYLDAHLRADEAARKWLDDRVIEKVSKGECELRRRN